MEMRLTSWGVLAIALAATGCAASGQQAQRAAPPNDQDYGVFAYDDGRLYRLTPESEYATRGSAPWNVRTDFDSDTRLVVNDPELPFGHETTRVELWRMMEVKNAEYSTPQRAGGLPPWIGTTAHEIPIRFDTYAARQAIEVIPTQPLAPGMYALLYDGDERTTLARFGVDWQNAETVAFNSEYCVDRVSQGDIAYRPCPPGIGPYASTEASGATATGTATAAALTPAGAFALNLDDPVHQMVGNESILLVSGQIANNSSRATAVPPIRLSLKDSTGNVLQSWDLPTPQAQLQPGESARFSQPLRDLPPGAATVAATLGQ
jgi:hypothetical protein